MTILWNAPPSTSDRGVYICSLLKLFGVFEKNMKANLGGRCYIHICLQIFEGVRCYLKIIEAIMCFIGVVDFFHSSGFDSLEESTLISISLI